MVPLVKGYSTEMSLEVTSLGVQVHGGMGFIEETGAAQYYRDAKILTIYEGTTAIQANDLVGRKTARDGGTSAKAIAAQIEDRERTGARGSAARAGRAKRLKARATRPLWMWWISSPPTPAATPMRRSRAACLT
jgi:3-(methylthio)propanoyl-CoA dehydrogenase